MGRPVYAVVLAGRRNDGALREMADTDWEALIDVCGTPMAGRVLQALSGTPDVAGGVVVGPEEIQTRGLLPKGFGLVLPGSSLVENLHSGVSALRTVTPDGTIPEDVLISTSDVPLVTAAMVESFLCATGDGTLDAYVPVVRRETAEARFPGVHRTYIHLKDGAFTMGNLFLVKSRLLEAGDGHASLLEGFVRLRKSPILMARTLGVGLVVGLATRQLTLADLERIAGGRIGIRGHAVAMGDPEIGVDVDKASDLELCREVLCHLAS